MAAGGQKKDQSLKAAQTQMLLMLEEWLPVMSSEIWTPSSEPSPPPPPSPPRLHLCTALLVPSHNVALTDMLRLT